MTILLNYHKAKPVDRAKFIETYTAITGYRMLNGSPIIVSVEGTYIKANDIPELILNRNQRVLSEVNRWLSELRNPTNVGKTKIEFIWRH